MCHEPKTQTHFLIMRIRVLGCSGALCKDKNTTSFLLNESVLIDAGTGVGNLTLQEMFAVDHVFLTHVHLDHIVCLPLMLDTVGSKRNKPVTVYALPETIAMLKKHVLNEVIWPDFTRLPSVDEPFMQFKPIQVGDVLTVDGLDITVLPAVHSVPAVGYAAQERGKPAWVFTGDTESNPPLWQILNNMDIAMLVIETAFSNQEADLARQSLHFSPMRLADELDFIKPEARYPIYITHTKPCETNQIMHEISEFDKPYDRPGEVEHNIQWLNEGAVFDI